MRITVLASTLSLVCAFGLPTNLWAADDGSPPNANNLRLSNYRRRDLALSTNQTVGTVACSANSTPYVLSANGQWVKAVNTDSLNFRLVCVEDESVVIVTSTSNRVRFIGFKDSSATFEYIERN